MATEKKTTTGSTPRAKKIVQKKIGEALGAYGKKTLKSGPGGKAGTVKNRKQAIAIALSEARKAGADVPPPPANSASAQKSGTKKKATKKAATKKKTRQA